MSTTLTIRNLAEPVKDLLRVQAARNKHSMEAEAREVLTRGVMGADAMPERAKTPRERMQKAIESVSGLWAGRGSTEDLMRLTRGED